MNVNLIRSAGTALVIALLAIMTSACSGDDRRHDPAYVTTNVETSSAFNLDDKRQLAGWADAIFVGTVLEKSGSEARTSLPETQFRVRVVKTLKGQLTDTVVVNQQGGFRSGTSARELVIVDGDPLITPGKSYLFATRLAAERNWCTIASGAGDVELTEAERRAMESSARTPGADAGEPEKVRLMRDAIVQQIPYKGPARPTVPNAPSTTDTPPSSAPATTITPTPSAPATTAPPSTSPTTR